MARETHPSFGQACPGCGRGFSERGLRSHQSGRFTAMGCRPVKPATNVPYVPKEA